MSYPFYAGGQGIDYFLIKYSNAIRRGIVPINPDYAFVFPVGLESLKELHAVPRVHDLVGDNLDASIAMMPAHRRGNIHTHYDLRYVPQQLLRFFMGPNNISCSEQRVSV